MHCQLNVTDDEVELQVLEGSVYMKNEEGEWEILDKNAIISYNLNQILLDWMFNHLVNSHLDLAIQYTARW